jgi:replicative DNA helicase
MAETTENTLTAYKGPEFQQRLMWQLLVEPEFAEKAIPELAIEYFDDPNFKRLFIIILEYFKKYEKVPNLQNQSIQQAINEFKTPNNVIEEESLFGVIKRIELWNERIINKQILYDGDVVQKATNEFIKQQEYRKLAESILDKVKNGAIKSKYEIAAIEEKFQKITHIGEEEDDCESVTEGIDKALIKEFRQTIPTGIGVIDALTGGGLGKGEIGLILTPSGVGKTTALTIIANTAYADERNVAQIVFEDTKDQIKRKHYTIWAQSALSRLDEEEEHVRVSKIAHERAKELEGKGRLVIKRFSQENTTMMDIRNWMIGYQKKWGFKFDLLVLDYLDCLESHKKVPDRNEAELQIVKSFEALASDFDIPAWSAIQSNRSGFGAEFVEANQTGGSIKRIQKAHFFMSVAKTPAQQDANLANIRIIKARFAKDGQTFEDCIFNNDTMRIIIDDPRYKYSKTYKNLKHYDEADVDKFENAADKLKDKSPQTEIHGIICERESQILKKLNDTGSDVENATIRDVKYNPSILNELLAENKQPENFHPEKEFHEKQILNDVVVSGDISEIPNTLKEVIIVKEKIDDLIELDETETISTVEITNVVPSAEQLMGADNDLLDFTGDTQTETITITEVTEEIPPVVVQEPVPNRIYDIVKLVQSPPISPQKENIPVNSNIKELEKTLLIDPDEPQGEDKSVFNILKKLRENQAVVKKEEK